MGLPVFSASISTSRFAFCPIASAILRRRWRRRDTVGRGWNRWCVPVDQGHVDVGAPQPSGCHTTSRTPSGDEGGWERVESGERVEGDGEERGWGW